MDTESEAMLSVSNRDILLEKFRGEGDRNEGTPVSVLTRQLLLLSSCSCSLQPFLKKMLQQT